jgi:hypothetical protein
MARMGHDESLLLRDAIRILTPADKWAAFLQILGGNSNDALSALSGQPAGRLLLDAEIASKSVYAEAERQNVRAFERLQIEINASFETRRRSGGLVLRGYTVTSPTRLVPIPRDLPLEYDFIHSTARSGDLEFRGVTVRTKRDGLTKVDAHSSYLRVSDAELEKFCRMKIKRASPVPSMDVLLKAAKTHFAAKHVARARVRDLHRVLIDPLSRRPGPRK